MDVLILLRHYDFVNENTTVQEALTFIQEYTDDVALIERGDENGVNVV